MKGWAPRLAFTTRVKVIRKWPYFFIIRSPSLFSYLSQSLTAPGSDLLVFHPRAWLQLRMSRTDFFCNKIHLDCITHDQTIIFAVFGKLRGGLSANEKEQKLHGTIINVIRTI